MSTLVRISRRRAETQLSAAFYSFVMFSPFTYSIFSLSGMYLLEAAIAISVLFCGLFNDSVGKPFVAAFRRRRNYLSVIVFGLVLFAAIGLARHGNFAEAYTDFRANALLVVGFALGREVVKTHQDKVFCLAIWTAVWSVAHWLIQYFSGDISTKFPTPLFAVVVATLFAVDHDDVRAMLVSVIALSFLAAVSFFRQYWIVAALIGGLAIVNLMRSKSVRPSAKIAVLCSIASVMIIGGSFIAAMFNSSESLYIQSIGKTNDLAELFGGGAASDSDYLRYSYFAYMIQEFPDLIFPHGLGHGANAEHFDPWFFGVADASNTADSLLLFIAYHYGYVILLPLVLWFATRMWRAQISHGAIRYLTLCATLMVPLLFDGGQAVVTVRAFWFGLFCAYLVTNLGNRSLRRNCNVSTPESRVMRTRASVGHPNGQGSR